MTEPRMPSRTRLYRPDLYADDVTGPLLPEVRDLYLALGGCADDHGWLLWRVALLGARIYPYEGVAQREAALLKRAKQLEMDRLLVVHPCGCAYLPRLVRDLATRSGQPSYAIEEHHQKHRRQPAPAEVERLPRTTPGDGGGVGVGDDGGDGAREAGALTLGAAARVQAPAAALPDDDRLFEAHDARMTAEMAAFLKREPLP